MTEPEIATRMLDRTFQPNIKYGRSNGTQMKSNTRWQKLHISFLRTLVESSYIYTQTQDHKGIPHPPTWSKDTSGHCGPSYQVTTGSQSPNTAESELSPHFI